MNQPVKIGIAEDNLLLRQGLVTMLKQQNNFEVLFDVNNGKELIDHLVTVKPDLILLDIRMPVMDGHEAYALIKKKYPALKVIVLSTHYTDAYITEFILDGVAGFLPKNCNFEKLVRAICAVHQEGCYFDAMVSSAMIARLLSSNRSENPVNALSEKQIEIMKLLCDEKNPDEIASALFLSRRTVEWHKNQILEKTGTKNVVGMVKYALNNGIVHL